MTEPILKKLSEDEEMRMWAEDHDRYVRTMATARSEGLSEGLAKGLTEGLAKGKAEAILELLGELGPVPEVACHKILEQKDLEILKRWLKEAAKATSVEAFLQAAGLS